MSSANSHPQPHHHQQHERLLAECFEALKLSYTSNRRLYELFGQLNSHAAQLERQLADSREECERLLRENEWLGHLSQMQSSSSSPNTSSSSPPHLVNTANVPDGPDLNQHHLHPNPSRQPAPCASTSNDNGPENSAEPKFFATLIGKCSCLECLEIADEDQKPKQCSMSSVSMKPMSPTSTPVSPTIVQDEEPNCVNKSGPPDVLNLTHCWKNRNRSLFSLSSPSSSSSLTMIFPPESPPPGNNDNSKTMMEPKRTTKFKWSVDEDDFDDESCV